jgi:hypothetical protein
MRNALEEFAAFEFSDEAAQSDEGKRKMAYCVLEYIKWLPDSCRCHTCLNHTLL